MANHLCSRIEHKVGTSFRIQVGPHGGRLLPKRPLSWHRNDCDGPRSVSGPSRILHKADESILETLLNSQAHSMCAHVLTSVTNKKKMTPA